MGKKFMIVFVIWGWAMFFSNAAMAQHQHDQGGAAKPSTTPTGKSADKENFQSKTVEGLKIAFEVMSMGEHMKHVSGSGHTQSDHSKNQMIMVTIQDTASKEIISDAKIQYTLSAPSGGKETGKLTWSGDHYGGGFSPKEKGVYQVNLRIESGGMERQAVFKYTAK